MRGSSDDGAPKGTMPPSPKGMRMSESMMHLQLNTHSVYEEDPHIWQVWDADLMWCLPKQSAMVLTKAVSLLIMTGSRELL